MNLFQSGYLVVALVCAAVSGVWAMIAARSPERLRSLLFAACALAAALDAFFVERRFVTAQSPAELHMALRWQAVSITTFLALLAVFLSVRTGRVRRPLLTAVLALLAATALVGFASPEALAFQLTSIERVLFPWGETISFGVGPAGPWRLVGDLANVTFLILLLDTMLRLAREGRHGLARWIGASFVVLSVSVLAIIPMDLGLLKVPPLHPFAFLLVVVFMTWELTGVAAKAARLSRKIATNEKRYRQLVERAQLLIIRLDADGLVREVNPHFVEVLGPPAADVIGRPLVELVAPEERQAASRSLSRVPGEGGTGAARQSMLGGDGLRRTIEWRYVALVKNDGDERETLGLGADVTERERAEGATRDALRRLERTVAELERLKGRLEEENLVLREEIGQRAGFEGIIGTSDGLQYVLHKIREVAPHTDASVLIQGETGVGKELVARTIHEQSGRAHRSFVVVNCAALPPGLESSELFGHERGAFTGADRRRRGRFELADGGTLFLDEIGELPLEVQPKLLRVLEDGEMSRVGGNQILHVDVRLIAATNRRLLQEVRQGRFREDLFYRLEGYPISVPPLRERTEDIAPLVFHFLRRINESRTVPLTELPREVLRRLEQYPWPGNVRELKHVVERASYAAEGSVLKLAGRLELDEGRMDRVAPPAAGGDGLVTLDEVQRRHIQAVLEACDGQIAGAGGAAEILGLHANTLRYRMKKLGIVRAQRSTVNETPQRRGSL